MLELFKLQTTHHHVGCAWAETVGHLPRRTNQVAMSLMQGPHGRNEQNVLGPIEMVLDVSTPRPKTRKTERLFSL